MKANNLQELKEATGELIKFCCNTCFDRHCEDEAGKEGCSQPLCSAVLRARDAINANPIRNCDVGTAEEQTKRFGKYCDRYDSDCTGCPCHSMSCYATFTDCFAKWAQMPYKKRDKKRDKRGNSQNTHAKEGGTK